MEKLTGLITGSRGDWPIKRNDSKSDKVNLFGTSKVGKFLKDKTCFYQILTVVLNFLKTILMSIVTGKLELICNNCGKQYTFAADDVDFEETGGDPGRNMGPEIQWAWETSFGCDLCQNPISVEYDVWEYPVGAFNDDDVRIEGGQEVSRFDYDFSESLRGDYTDNDFPDESEDVFVEKTVTIGDLRRDLELYPDEFELYFEGFNYEQVRQKGENLVQIQLSPKPGFEAKWEQYITE